jgi:hypothetical protein
MTTKPSPDLNKLAAEALDLWQEHLAALASDPKAKADLAQMMEPSRRMFAEWMKKAQATSHDGAETFPFATQHASGGNAADGAATVRPASDDGTLRLAQLALHVAELEKRVAKLEARKSRTAAKAANPSGRNE